MQKLLLLFFFSLTLFGDNPKVYTQVGDSIYDNIKNIEALKELTLYKEFEQEIDSYSKDVKRIKSLGFAVEDGSRSNIKLDYLKEIRKLDKVNKYFFRSVIDSFKLAIKVEDNDLFIGIVNSDLLDTTKYKKSIMDYYSAHKDKINSQGVIQDFLDEAYAKKHKKRWKPKSKKQLHEEKVKRLRKNDKLKQEALEIKLADELKLKKQKIRETQEKELFH